MVEESLRVKEYIRSREAETGCPLLINDWALFNIS